jgi:hypothetical protein
MAYNANTNIENERKYLDKLISEGGGKAVWAENQKKELEKFAASQPQTTQPPKATTGATYSVDDQGVKWRHENGYQYRETPVNTMPMVDNIYAQMLAQQRAAEEAAIRAKVEQGVQTLQGSKQGINKAYEDSSRQAYILAEKNKARMPQQLSAMGITGGLAQQTALESDLAYQNALNQGRIARDTSLQAIDQDINKLRISGDLSIAENAANYSARLAEELRQAQIRQQEQANWQAQFDAQQAQREQANQENAYIQRLNQAKILAQYGDFSGYKALGYDTSIMEAAYQRQLAEQNAPKTSGTAKVSKPTATQYQTALNAYMNGDQSQGVISIIEAYSGLPLQTVLTANGITPPQNTSSVTQGYTVNPNAYRIAELAAKGYTDEEIARIINNFTPTGR